MDRRSHRSRHPHDLHTTAKTWRSRSGRLSGPEEYVAGDVVSSIFLHSRTMSQRERHELYGCPVLLVGVYSAAGIPDTTPSTRLYISLRTTSKDGADMRSGRLVSHVVTPTTDSTHPPGTFDFDEVFTLGTQGDLSDVDHLTVRVKQLQGAFNTQRLVGTMSISLKQLAAEAGPESPPFEAFFDVGAPPGAPVPGATVGSLHLRFFCEPALLRRGVQSALTRTFSRAPLPAVHFPPPDPVPVAVHVTIAEGRGLLARDTTGFSDPYVRVRPMLLRGKQPTLTAWGRAAEYRSTTQAQTVRARGFPSRDLRRSPPPPPPPPPPPQPLSSIRHGLITSSFWTAPSPTAWGRASPRQTSTASSGGSCRLRA